MAAEDGDSGEFKLADDGSVSPEIGKGMTVKPLLRVLTEKCTCSTL